MRPDATERTADALDARAVRRSFARAAATYDSAAVLQREIGARMAERLDVVRIAPTAILDAGCGTGDALPVLAQRYPAAQRIALDVAHAMLALARERHAAHRSALARVTAAFRRPEADASWFVCADIAALPLASRSVDLVWSNLALQWVNDVPRVLAEWRRVLKVGGLAMFATFGPDTLQEIRKAFARADGHTHVNRFIDMHDLGDMLVEAGFADPVMDMEKITLTYPDPAAMLRELKQLGATNATRGRPHGLMGRGRWMRMLRVLEAMRTDGTLPATFEVVYGHAWKGEPRRTAEGHPIVKLTRPPKA